MLELLKTDDPNVKLYSSSSHVPHDRRAASPLACAANFASELDLNSLLLFRFIVAAFSDSSMFKIEVRNATTSRSAVLAGSKTFRHVAASSTHFHLCQHSASPPSIMLTWFSFLLLSHTKLINHHDAWWKVYTRTRCQSCQFLSRKLHITVNVLSEMQSVHHRGIPVRSARSSLHIEKVALASQQMESSPVHRCSTRIMHSKVSTKHVRHTTPINRAGGLLLNIKDPQQVCSFRRPEQKSILEHLQGGKSFVG